VRDGLLRPDGSAKARRPAVTGFWIGPTVIVIVAAITAFTVARPRTGSSSGVLDRLVLLLVLAIVVYAIAWVFAAPN